MDNREIELQALITERDGMLAENMQCAHCRNSIPYRDDEFHALADRMRALKLPDGEEEPEIAPRAFTTRYFISAYLLNNVPTLGIKNEASGEWVYWEDHKKALEALHEECANWQTEAHLLEGVCDDLKAENAKLRELLDRLKDTCRNALAHIHCDEVAHGRNFGVGNVLRDALRKYDEVMGDGKPLPEAGNAALNKQLETYKADAVRWAKKEEKLTLENEKLRVLLKDAKEQLSKSSLKIKEDGETIETLHRTSVRTLLDNGDLRELAELGRRNNAIVPRDEWRNEFERKYKEVMGDGDH